MFITLLFLLKQSSAWQHLAIGSASLPRYPPTTCLYAYCTIACISFRENFVKYYCYFVSQAITWSGSRCAIGVHHFVLVSVYFSSVPTVAFTCFWRKLIEKLPITPPPLSLKNYPLHHHHYHLSRLATLSRILLTGEGLGRTLHWIPCLYTYIALIHFLSHGSPIRSLSVPFSSSTKK